MSAPHAGPTAQAGSREDESHNGGRPGVAPARLNPTDLHVSLAARGGSGVLLSTEDAPRRQELPGFDPAYADIVDYIVRITQRIWDEKDIGHIYDVYRHNCRVIGEAGLRYGAEQVVADTVQAINAFPDIRLLADEVIWAADASDAFHTSHRLTKVGRNAGHSRWGPPTGRKIAVWSIANCVSRANQIFEEWVAYNTGALLVQLGFELPALARALANAAAPQSLVSPPNGEVERLAGQGPPRHMAASHSTRFDLEDFLRRAYHYLWNWRNLSVVDRAYAETVRYHGATGRELFGRDQLRSLVLSLLAMFPDLAMEVDDLYWMGNDADGYLVAVRWTALGTHRGHGIYGAPTGRRVLIWGLSQHRIAGERIEEEWTLFNEFEVMQQLMRDEPAGATLP